YPKVNGPTEIFRGCRSGALILKNQKSQQAEQWSLSTAYGAHLRRGDRRKRDHYADRPRAADEPAVEAKVAAQDLDQIASGAEAVVHIMAGNRRGHPGHKGIVTRVSADITRATKFQSAGTGVLHGAHCPPTRRDRPLARYSPRSRHAGPGLRPSRSST